MNGKIMKVAALAALFVLTVGGSYYLWAQMGGGGRPGQQQMGGMNRQMGMMPGGMGGAAMVVYGKHIFVLSGPTLTKIDPVGMKVEGELTLKRQMRPGGRQGGREEMGMDEE